MIILHLGVKSVGKQGWDKDGGYDYVPWSSEMELSDESKRILL